MNIWIALAQALKKAAAFMSRRLRPELLRERFEADMASVAFGPDGKIIGYAALWLTPIPGIVEFGTAFVEKDWRGELSEEKMKEVVFSGVLKQTICESLLAQCAQKMRDKKLRGVMVTDQRGLIEKACAAGWVIDGVGHYQGIRWLLTGEDRPVRVGSEDIGTRTMLIFYPD